MNKQVSTGQEPQKKPAEGKDKQAEKPADKEWQSLFTKRLPHRIGQPLSSGGGGDGSSA